MKMTLRALRLGAVLAASLSLSTAAANAGAMKSDTATNAAVGTPIQTLETPNLSAADFNNLFKPIDSAPTLTSPFQFQDTPASGIIRSQVFQGTGAAEGLRAFAYQVSVNDVQTAGGEPTHVDSISFRHNSTPVGTDFLKVGKPVYAYAITDGAVGGLIAPTAGNGDGIRLPDRFSWQAGQTTGTIRASWVNASGQVQPLWGGATSATFIVLSKDPITKQFVNVQSSNPTTGEFTPVYAATGGSIQPLPVPEPSTVLAWTGMIGAAAFVRRYRVRRRTA